METTVNIASAPPVCFTGCTPFRMKLPALLAGCLAAALAPLEDAQIADATGTGLEGAAPYTIPSK